MRKAGPGEPLGDDDEARLRDIEVRLDQCWDLLRQRRAAPRVRPRPRGGARSVRPTSSSTTSSSRGTAPAAS